MSSHPLTFFDLPMWLSFIIQSYYMCFISENCSISNGFICWHVTKWYDWIRDLLSILILCLGHKICVSWSSFSHSLFSPLHMFEWMWKEYHYKCQLKKRKSCSFKNGNTWVIQMENVSAEVYNFFQMFSCCYSYLLFPSINVCHLAFRTEILKWKK